MLDLVYAVCEWVWKHQKSFANPFNNYACNENVWISSMEHVGQNVDMQGDLNLSYHGKNNDLYFIVKMDYVNFKCLLHKQLKSKWEVKDRE